MKNLTRSKIEKLRWKIDMKDAITFQQKMLVLMSAVSTKLHGKKGIRLTLQTKEAHKIIQSHIPNEILKIFLPRNRLIRSDKRVAIDVLLCATIVYIRDLHETLNINFDKEYYDSYKSIQLYEKLLEIEIKEQKLIDEARIEFRKTLHKGKSVVKSKPKSSNKKRGGVPPNIKFHQKSLKKKRSLLIEIEKGYTETTSTLNGKIRLNKFSIKINISMNEFTY